MSYTIGPKSLRLVCPWLSKDEARRIAAALGEGFHEYGITTQRRAAMAVAQMAHESAGFRTTTEFASGAEYEGRRDLGNTHPGDGVRYKGRGFIQITGRTNYSEVGRVMGHDFLARPADLARLGWAAKASCWWWRSHGCNQLADNNDFVGLTRRINGGTNGLASRRAFYMRARAVSRWLVPRKA